MPSSINGITYKRRRRLFSSGLARKLMLPLMTVYRLLLLPIFICFICHVARVKAAANVKAATSAHSMVDVIPFFSVFNIPFESNASITPNENVFYTKQENNINNIFRVLMFQQVLANKHHRLHTLKSR